MKVLLFVVAVFSAGVAASPGTERQGRVIEGIISGILEDLIIDMQESGLDPLLVERETFTYKLPVTDLLQASAVVEDLLVEGLSNIVLNNLDFSILASRLRFDISLPRISATIGGVDGNLAFASREADGALSGSLSIVEPRISGEARIDGISIIGIIGGSDISIRSLTVNFRIQDIQSNLNVELFGENYSGIVNSVLGVIVPGFLTEYSNDVNELLAYIAIRVANDLLSD